MRDNFVDIVGFQLERVHTGALAWLLNSRSASIPIADKLKLLQGLTGSPLPLVEQDVTRITPLPEYTTDKRRIDLVLRIEQQAQPPCFVVIECKVDCDLSIKQIKETREGFLAIKPHPLEERCRFIALLVGASAFTHQHHAEALAQHRCTIVDCERLLELLQALSVKDSCSRLSEWIDALQREALRWSGIEAALRVAGTLPDRRAALVERGYRWDFPVMYTAYHQLRAALRTSALGLCSIYSGSNNAVMHIPTAALRCDGFSFHLEFNDQALRLKAKVPDKSEHAWQAARLAMQKRCAQLPFKGRRTKNRTGSWRCVYKWPFNFFTQSFSDIARDVAAIVAGLTSSPPQ